MTLAKLDKIREAGCILQLPGLKENGALMLSGNDEKVLPGVFLHIDMKDSMSQ